MTTLLTVAALAVTGAACMAGGLVLARTRALRVALPVFLDLLTAAGLLRSATTSSWTALAVTASVIVLRHVVTAGVRTVEGSLSPTAHSGGTARSVR